MTKVETAIKTLRKGRWINRETLVDVLAETDLRTVRRLREYGYNIVVRNTEAGIQYKRA